MEVYVGHDQTIEIYCLIYHHEFDLDFYVLDSCHQQACQGQLRQVAHHFPVYATCTTTQPYSTDHALMNWTNKLIIKRILL